MLADWQDTLVDGAVAGAVASTGVDKAKKPAAIAHSTGAAWLSLRGASVERMCQ